MAIPCPFPRWRESARGRMLMCLPLIGLVEGGLWALLVWLLAKLCLPEALGALCAADELGLRVPQDISVIGYDNVRNARFFTPALTTIHQPKDSLGETAFNMLLDRIVNKREQSQSIEVHPRLIERRSVADGPFRDYRR